MGLQWALQILTNDDEVENRSLSSFLLAVPVSKIGMYENIGEDF